MINLNTSIKKIPRIKANQIKALERLKINTWLDLLFHFPSRYEDFSQIKNIRDIEKGEKTSIEGKIIQAHTQRTWKKRMLITETLIEDKNGDTIKAIWFNQPFLKNSLQTGKNIRLSGKIYLNQKNELYFSAPDWELSQRRPTHTARLVPVYPTTENLTSRWIRWQIETIFKKGINLPEIIPLEIIQKFNLPERGKALKFIHFPQNIDQIKIAQKRFAFEEIFLLQIKSLQSRFFLSQKKASAFILKKSFYKKFLHSLSFSPTQAQEKAVQEIFKDLSQNVPMNRLLNGDVGAGKTLVAAMASLPVLINHHQVAIMAPTEVLAYQHFQSFQNFFQKFLFNIALITNSYKQVYYSQEKEIRSFSQGTRYQLLQQIKKGTINMIIGTHALLQKDVSFKNLSLVIIDEQHRFGVEQRAYLQKKHSTFSNGIHFLTMTATPIPRTLTMAFFGNLAVSVLDELPSKRRKIITKIVPNENRNKIYQFIRSKIKKGRQAFIILPLVEESSLLQKTKAVIQEHKRLTEKVFPDLNIGLLHGKLKPKEKEEIMKKFKENQYQILVSTSVVEVGIDVPNATIMIIEDAHRFGLSQLHQFRGRIGRGKYQSYCFLFSPQVSSRLKIMEKYNDGFKIAEKDLELRGPGQFLGQKQSGLPDVAMEGINNLKMISLAREEAEKLLKKDSSLKKYPLLKSALQKMGEQIHLE